MRYDNDTYSKQKHPNHLVLFFIISPLQPTAGQRPLHLLAIFLLPPNYFPFSVLFFLPLSHYVGSVQHVFHHVVVKIRHLFLRPAACLTSALLETGVDANDYKCCRDQQLNVLSEARSTVLLSLDSKISD
jgi:hypothetical protein